MNISKSRLIQIIKEEIENMREMSHQHEGKTCAEAHGGLSHKEWASSEHKMLSSEEA
mgnify:CR=1 FL=1